LSLLEPHTKPQSSKPVQQAPNRRINGRFAKGYSGNPAGHKTFAATQALIRKQADALLKALRDELGSKVSAVDLAFAEQAALMLSKASYSEKRRVYLTTKAGAIIERLRARYPRSGRTPSLGEILRRG